MSRKREKGAVDPVRTVAFVTAASILSKAVGLVRSSLLASRLGAGIEASAFTAASSLPLRLFDLLLGAAIPGCLIPVFSRAEEGEKRGYARSFLLAVTAACAALCLIGIPLAPALLRLAAPGLSGEAAEKAVLLTRLIFPSVLFAGGVSVCTGLLQSEGRHLPPALISLFSNILLICYLCFPDADAVVLSVLVPVSWGIQLLSLAIPLGFGKRLPPGKTSVPVSRALSGYLPVTLSSWLPPACTLLCAARMTVLTEGGNTLFEYACSLFLLLCGLVSGGVCGYLFPLLSEHPSSGLEKKGAEWILLLSLPVSVLAFVLAKEGVSILYLHGAFPESAAETTALLVKCAAPAIPFSALWEYLRRLCLSRGLSRLPAISSLCGVLSCLLLSLFARSVLAVGIAFSLSFAVPAVLTLLFLPGGLKGEKEGKSRGLSAILFSFLPLPFASFGLYRLVSPVTGGLITCALVSVPTLSIYLLLLYLLKFPLPEGRA